VADWTPSSPSQSPLVIEAIWQLECDGAYCKSGSGASAILTAPSGTQLKYATRLEFPGCTNNVAEYEGLLLGLRKARALGARRLSIKTDSELITNHIGKTYRAIKPELAKYLAAVRCMEKIFFWVLVCEASPDYRTNRQMFWRRPQQKMNHCLRTCFFESLRSGSINCAEDPVKFVNAISSEDWRSTIVAYLQGHFVPKDVKEEKRLALRARNYSIINDTLYRGGVYAPLLKCISQAEGRQLLLEIHAGMCSSHIRTRALVGKAFREGFYWPSAMANAHEILCMCPNC
jgi:ribonuclease HI